MSKPKNQMRGVAIDIAPNAPMSAVDTGENPDIPPDVQAELDAEELGEGDGMAIEHLA